MNRYLESWWFREAVIISGRRWVVTVICLQMSSAILSIGLFCKLGDGVHCLIAGFCGAVLLDHWLHFLRTREGGERTATQKIQRLMCH